MSAARAVVSCVGFRACPPVRWPGGVEVGGPGAACRDAAVDGRVTERDRTVRTNPNNNRLKGLMINDI